MININITITNPWSKRWDIVWSKSRQLSTNKAVELNIYKTNALIVFEFGLFFRVDHAGVNAKLGVFGREVEIHFYDTRHWNYETNTWEKYE